MEEKISVNRKKFYLITGGFLLLAAVIMDQAVNYSISQDTNQLITNNAFSIFFIFISFLLIYSGFKRTKNEISNLPRGNKENAKLIVKSIKRYSPDILIIFGILIYSLFKFRDWKPCESDCYSGEGSFNYLTLEFICTVLIVVGIEIFIRRFISYRKK